MNTYNCTICNDTGKRLLPNGQHSDYVDCSCQAATERAELDVAVTVFVQSYEGDLQNAPADTRWFVHQRAVKMQAARIAELERENARLDAALDGEISCRDHYHEWADKLAAEISRYFGVDIGEHSNANNPWEQAYEAVPAAPAVEQQPIRWLMSDGSCTADRRYGEGYGGKPLYLAPAPQAADTDKVREASAWEALRADVLQGVDGLDNDQVNTVLGMIDYYMPTADMAAQAPVGEVPGWQPIGDSLPSDDCRVLAATWFDMTQVQQVEVVSFRAGSGTFSDCNVTHWQPLPEPPAAPVQQEGDRG